eukprot:5394495-Alexandrium_andersonii.AAC.1
MSIGQFDRRRREVATCMTRRPIASVLSKLLQSALAFTMVVIATSTNRTDNQRPSWVRNGRSPPAVQGDPGPASLAAVG